MKEIIRLRKQVYVYEEFKVWIFRFVYCRFGKKFTIRLELSKGWED